MIVKEEIKKLEKVIATNPDKDTFETDNFVAIRVGGDNSDTNQQRIEEKRETNLTQGVVNIGDDKYEIFLK